MSDETPTEPTAPKYLVYPIEFQKVDPRYVTDQVSIIDLGESFEASNPPIKIGTPLRYCPPELLLDGTTASKASDIWALACTLFQIRTGQKLFDSFDNDVDEYLYFIVLMLGKLPEPWWTD